LPEFIPENISLLEVKSFLGGMITQFWERRSFFPRYWAYQALGDQMPHCWEAYEPQAMTGMRLGEALAMRRGNLDAANGQYLIAETTRKGYGPPKSGKRLIDLEEGLVTKLESHIKKLRQESLAAGTEVIYLFPGLTQRLVQGAMRRACLAAKLRIRRPHGLRHTYATLLLMDH
jgi:integrase